MSVTDEETAEANRDDQRMEALHRRYSVLDRRDPEYTRLRREAFDLGDKMARYSARNPLFFWLPAFNRFCRRLFESGAETRR